MIDFPIGELLGDSHCSAWLEPHLHLGSLQYPHCGSTRRRLFLTRAISPHTVAECAMVPLTDTVFPKTHQRLATRVLLLRGMAKGEPTTRLGREDCLSRKQLYTLRQRIQANLNVSAPMGKMTGTAFEADELYLNVGKKAPRILILPSRHGGAPISVMDMTLTPTIAHR